MLEMGYGRQELAAAVAAEGLRPMLPRRCPPGLAALLGRCWDADPGRRPSFAAVRAELEALLEQCGEDLVRKRACAASPAGDSGAVCATQLMLVTPSCLRCAACTVEGRTLEQCARLFRMLPRRSCLRRAACTCAARRRHTSVCGSPLCLTAVGRYGGGGACGGGANGP